LDICFSAKEQESLLLAVQDEHPDGFDHNMILDAIERIDAAKAEATKEEDRVRILREMAEGREG
jgi:hypothetical protein